MRFSVPRSTFCVRKMTSDKVFGSASHIGASLIILSSVCLALVDCIPADYAQQRMALIHTEQDLRLGGSGSNLTPDEQFVNKLLIQEKSKLIEAARLNGSDFPAMHSFLNLTARAAMEATDSFRIIRKMPKGGLLHIHDESIASIDWLVKNVTYRDHCYMCVDSTYNVKFHFYQTPPSDPNCQWRLVMDLRRESGNANAFDESLQRNISLVTENYAEAYPDVNAVWKKFMDYFGKAEGLMLHAPVFGDYFRQGLYELLEDNVQYVEMRALLPPTYELDGTVHDHDWALAVYKQIINEIMQQNPGFIGGRIIMTSIKFKTKEAMLQDVKTAMRLYQADPDFMVGFDLVGQEDPLHPLIFYIDELLYPSRQDPPVYLPFFFHAGETNWQDTASDYNLVDAVLLNTSRIGHGYALYKHPVLMDRVVHDGIAVEINPISNQVLGLVKDMRNHPAASLISQNLPLVVCSDDFGAWEALPLSHDFYLTFMALTGEDTGLATLKQLAINSFRYSSMSPAEKQKAIFRWQEQWNSFIQDIVHETMQMAVIKPTVNAEDLLIG